MKALLIVLISLNMAAAASHHHAGLRLHDLTSEAQVSGDQALEKMKAVRMILVGEHHTDPAHHAAQLRLIRALHESGRDIAIGLEMFRHDRDPILKQWVQGELTEADLKAVYFEDWNFPWDLYRPIFDYARQNRIPMLGLNVPRDITRQVARQGFDSLSSEQKEILGHVTCDITPAYRDFVARAHGMHGHGEMTFDSFCEAQMVWDTAMAVHAVRFLEQNPGHTLIILAGSGHARRPGIPTQVRQRSAVSLSVILPFTPGVFEPATLSAEEADYLLLPEG